MLTFGDKEAIVTIALGNGGAFDKNRKTDKDAVFRYVLEACRRHGKEWTDEDSRNLHKMIERMEERKSGI